MVGDSYDFCDPHVYSATIRCNSTLNQHQSMKFAVDIHGSHRTNPEIPATFNTKTRTIPKCKLFFLKV